MANRASVALQLLGCLGVVSAIFQYYCASQNKHVVIVNSRSETTQDFDVRGRENGSIATNIRSDFLKEVELVVKVTTSEYPVQTAGFWELRPYQSQKRSTDHLTCLDLERQGNCHNYSANLLSPLKGRQSRVKAIETGVVINNPEILNGWDPWVWRSELESYSTLSDDQWHDTSTQQVIANRTYYFMGDSLMRQWSHSIKCDLQHVFRMSKEEADKTVIWLEAYGGDTSFTRVQNHLKHSHPDDYFIFNYGLHINYYKYQSAWPEQYRKVLENGVFEKYGSIPANHVLFRTTNSNFYVNGKGDWNSATRKVGDTKPNIQATWSMFGGTDAARTQPRQNLMALEYLLSRCNDTCPVGGILDISSMSLARSDASFDGNHFCMPGPIDSWTRMLFSRVIKEARNGHWSSR